MEAVDLNDMVQADEPTQEDGVVYNMVAIFGSVQVNTVPFKLK